MLLLMTMDYTLITTPETREYLQLRRSKELKKSRRRLDEEEEQELARQVVESKRVAEELARTLQLLPLQL